MRPKREAKILLLWCFILLSQQLQAQYFKPIGLDEGLPNNTVKCFAQDADGFLWLGTYGGLARYDGYGFLSFSKQDGDSLSISDNEVHALCGDSTGLWVATYRSLERFNYADQKFRHCYELRGGKRHVFKENFNSVIDVGGKIFARASSGKVYVHKQGVEFAEYGAARDYDAHDIAMLDANTLLIYTNRGLVAIDVRTGRKAGSVDFSPDQGVTSTLYYSPERRTAYIGNGLFHATHAIKIDRDYKMTVDREARLPRNVCAFAEAGGDLFMGTDGQGLYSLDRDQFYTPESHNLSNNVVYSLFSDKDDNLFIGTYRGGMSLLSSHYNVFRTFTKADGLSFGFVSSVYTQGGTIYAGTDGGGLNIIGRDGKVEVLNASNSQLPGNNILSIQGDSSHLWLGIYSVGLCRLDLKTREVKRYDMPLIDGEPWLNVLWQLMDDGKGHLWVKGLHAYRFDKRSGQFTELTALGQSLVKRIYLDSQSLWASTNEGIFQIDTSTLKLRRHYIGSVTGKQITSLFVDRKHYVWLTESNGGLWRMDTRTGRLRQFGQDEGLSTGLIESIVDDRDGNVWLGTDKGLYRFDLESEAFSHYGKGDNLQLTQFSRNAATLHNDTMLFGTSNGLVVFDIADIKYDSDDAHVFFNSLHVLKDRRSLLVSGQNPDRITLRSDQNFFTVSFSSPELLAAYSQKFQYRMRGFHDDWQTIGDTRQVSFTNVPTGSYVLELRASNSNGNWSAHVSQLPIRILPPWYLAWWACLLWIALALGVAFVIYHIYSSRLEMKRQLHEQEVERQLTERTNEEKLNFFTSFTHELRTPMFLITAPLEELLASEQRPVQVPYGYLKRMYRNANRLNKLVNRIIDIRKLESGTLQLQPRRHDLVKLLTRLGTDYKHLLKQKGIAFRLVAPEKLAADYDVEKLELIVSNLISNAYKYTNGGGEVTLSVGQSDNEVRLTVADTGIGISEDDIGKIFDSYYRANNNASAVGDGLGLAFVRKLVQLHGGTITVSSKLGEGSTFEVTLPRWQESKGSVKIRLPILDAEPEDTEEDTDDDDIRMTQEDGADKREGQPVVQDPTAPHCILIVDDEQDTADMLANYLVSDYRIHTATDGEDALRKAREILPDLIICDIAMPKMDGFTLLSKIRGDKRLAHIPVIMLSARMRDEDRIVALQGGADAYLTKPVSLRLLHAQTERLLSSRPDPHSPLANASITKEDRRFLLRCKEVIDTRMKEPNFGVEYMASEMGMSQSALYKKVKAVTGKSTVDMIVEYRIFKAVQLFQDGEANVTHVSRECGFNDTRSFRAAFKNRMGMSPKQFVQSI